MMQETGSKFKSEVFSAVDPAFDSGLAGNYNLFCEIGEDFFIYTVLDTVRNQFIVLKEHRFQTGSTDFFFEQFEKCIAGDDLLVSKFNKVKIIFSERRNLLVPDSLFDPAKAKTLFTYTREIEEKEMLCHKKLQGKVLLFPVHERFYNLFCQTFTSPEIIHSGTVMMNRSKDEKNVLFCNIRKTFFEIVLKKEGMIEKMSSDEYCADEDIVYYLLWLAKKYDFLFSDIILTGHLTEQQKKIISAYIPGIRMDQMISGFTLSYLFSRKEPYRFMNLYRLKDCE